MHKKYFNRLILFIKLVIPYLSMYLLFWKYMNLIDNQVVKKKRAKVSIILLYIIISYFILFLNGFFINRIAQSTIVIYIINIILSYCTYVLFVRLADKVIRKA